MKKNVWAVDFGQAVVVVIAAEIRPGEPPRLLAKSERESQGLDRGEIVHTGDAVECLVASIREVEKAAGISCGTVFYAFDDPLLESRIPSGSKTLAGEGQIRPADVQQAVNAAQRQVGNFEKSAVYVRETGFIIDGKDQVHNPVGVFGRQLDVTLQVLMARAEHLENWRRVFGRARIKSSVPVLSIVASVAGVLDAEQRHRGGVLWDLGQDILSGIVLERGVLRGHVCRAYENISSEEMAAWIGAQSAGFFKDIPGVEAIYLTGDWAEKGSFVERVQKKLPRPASVVFPQGLAGLGQPRAAAAAGLLHVAGENRASGPTPVTRAHLAASLKQKAVAFVNDYF